MISEIDFGSTVVISALLALWLFIGLLPEMVYEIQTRNFKDSAYILMKHHLRPQSPKILVERRRGWDELLPIFAYTLRLAIAGSLLLYKPSSDENFLLIVIGGAYLFVVCMMVAVSPLVLLNVRFFDRQMTRVPYLSLSEFYELTEQKISFWIEENSGNEGTNRSLQELLEHNEDERLEFKASMWTVYKTVNKISTEEIVDIGKKADYLQDEILHTVAAFLNTSGGTLLIGVKDKPISWGNRPAEVFGVQADYKWLGENNRDADGYILAVYQVLNNGFSDTYTTANYVNIKVEQFNGKEICRIDVDPLPRIRDAQVYIKEKTDKSNSTAYYVRTGPSSQKMSLDSALNHIRSNFPPPNAP